MLQEDKLVFIVSQPRAGSTLLQAVLSNHSKVDTCSEHWMLLKFASFLKPELLQASFGQVTCSYAFQDFLEKKNLKVDFQQDIKKLLLKYYAEIQTGNNHFVIDKTPRYYEILPEIINLFPKAKFIILIRNPLDTSLSMMKTWNRYDYHSLCWFHKRDILLAPFIIKDLKEKYSNDPRVRTITYEEMLSDPESTISDISQWIGIDYSSGMLNYFKNNKFKGKYGDPEGVYKYKSMLKRQDNSKGKNNISKSYNRFAIGYAHYLGKPFLKRYGHYELPSIKPTFEFKFFKFYCDHFKTLNKYDMYALPKLFIKYIFIKIYSKAFGINLK